MKILEGPETITLPEWRVNTETRYLDFSETAVINYESDFANFWQTVNKWNMSRLGAAGALALMQTVSEAGDYKWKTHTEIHAERGTIGKCPPSTKSVFWKASYARIRATGR